MEQTVQRGEPARAVEVLQVLGSDLIGVSHVAAKSSIPPVRWARELILAGAVLLASAVACFAYGVHVAEENRVSQQAWLAEGQPAEDWRPQRIAPLWDFVALVGLVGGGLFLVAGFERRRTRSGHSRFSVGSDAGADCSVDVGDDISCDVVDWSGEQPLVRVPAGFTAFGRDLSSGHSRPLSTPGNPVAEIPLVDDFSVSLKRGPFQLKIHKTVATREILAELAPQPDRRWLGFAAASAVAHLAVLALLMAIPPDPRTLSLSDGEDDRGRLSSVADKAKEDPRERPADPGEAGGSAPGEAGLAKGTRLDTPPEGGAKGTANAPSQRRVSQKTSTPQLAQTRQQAIERARTGGILGEINRELLIDDGLADFSSDADAVDQAGVRIAMMVPGAGDYGPGFGNQPGGDPSGRPGWGTIKGNYNGLPGPGGDCPTCIAFQDGRSPLTRKHRRTGPKVKIGPPTGGGPNKSIIRRYIRKHLARVTHCYERELLVRPGLTGTVLASFNITPQGRVLGSRARGLGNQQVEACIADVMASIQFPRFESSVVANVTYPFHLRPSGG